ncbi:MAG: alpha/beta hydrolase [Chloroflexi bacterium]|nr:alpha/beta hydrolase [Chloroflexota bacterium]
MPRKERAGSPLLAGLGGVVSAVASLIGGWIAYSRLFVNHDMRLPLAINADRKIFTSLRIGVASYYADVHAPGRPLVLVHSINAAASAYEMRPLFERYRGERPVYALDLPGFGFSERSNREYSPQLYAQTIIEFLATQVPEPADVVALSLGSEFVARAALERPDLFHSITLLSPSGLRQSQNDLNPAEVEQRNRQKQVSYGLLAFPLWSQAFYDLLTTRPSIRYFLQMSFVGDVPPDLVEYAYLTAHQPGARYAPLHFVSGRLFTPNIAGLVYERLKVPVLVIYDEDPFVSFDLLPRVMNTCANWKAVRIAPTKGLAHWDKLDETAPAIEAFWREAVREQAS